jgi:hypothetical protein
MLIHLSVPVEPLCNMLAAVVLALILLVLLSSKASERDRAVLEWVERIVHILLLLAIGLYGTLLHT